VTTDDVRPPAALLAAAGLEHETSFLRAFSYSSDVWIGDAVVLRVARAGDAWTLTHEQEVMSWLCDAVPRARILAAGEHKGRAWQVMERVVGEEVASAWPEMSVQHRRDVIHQLGQAMQALHRVEVPTDWQRPDLTPVALAGLRTPEQIAAPFQAPPTRIWALGEAARARPGVDTGLLDAAIQLVVERLPLFACDERRLVHTDLHWANLMTDGSSLTAILDFERARPAAADLDLDVLLRFSYWPRLPVAPEYESALHAADFQQVPVWLAEVYPQLFARPQLRERLEVYAIVHDLRQGIQFPDVPGVTKPPSWPWNRLRATLAGHSYLAEWL
jgi:aminoglycoside phosphotransferase (APT) family kinase protein